MQYYTAGTMSGTSNHLLRFRTGATWVYADSIDTYTRVLADHRQRMATCLCDTVLATFQYVTVLVRNDETLKQYDRRYVQFLVNATCAAGLSEKLLARSERGKVYAAYVASSNTWRIREAIATAYTGLARSRVVRFKQLADACFGGRKGSFFWGRSVCEHLVQMNLATHQDEWSIRAIN